MLACKAGINYEVRLKIDPSHIGGSDVIKGVLMGLGVDERRIVECAQWPDIEISVYYNDQAKAQSLKKRVHNLHLRHVQVNIKHILKKDWQAKWKNNFKPFALTKAIDIVPVRYRKTYRSRSRTPIYIDTDLAFGTGLHATTRFMAQLIERCRGKVNTFLDIGTGTGILSVIAAHCGATEIRAIDISADAVKVARSNFQKNQCVIAELRKADAYKIKGRKQYDFVCANIITHDLIQLADKLVSMVRPGKFLAISGISVKSYDLLRETYARYPLRCMKVEKGEGWTALLFKKNQ